MSPHGVDLIEEACPPRLCLAEHKLMGEKRHQIGWDATGL